MTSDKQQGHIREAMSSDSESKSSGMFPLTSLPEEIFTYHLLPVLDVESIVNLSRVLNVKVSKELYRVFFHENTKFDHYDVKMFHERAQCRLFAFGDPYFWQLGTPKNFPADYYQNDPINGMVSMCRPYAVPIEGHIAKVCTSWRTVQIITTDGNLYFLGTENGYDITTRFRASSGTQRFVGSSYTSGRINAIDVEGRYWCWDTEDLEEEYGLGKEVDCVGRCAQIHSDTLYIDGWGITAMGGYFVPDTAHGILDFCRFRQRVAYLRRDGTVEISYEERRNPGHFSTVIPDHINVLGPFIQISSGSSGPEFCLVTESGKVVMVHRYECDCIEMILQDQDIASVSVGYDHCLALTRQGEVYSWGRERPYNGCLGLGTLKEALAVEGASIRAEKLVLDRPTKIKLPGKAYGVFAGTNYSAVLVYEKSEP